MTCVTIMLRTIVACACMYAALAATSGNFTVLTYNIAGLPEPLSSGHPSVNTPLISPRLGQFNVVNVQEDFNYHSALYADDKHVYRTKTSGPAVFGSGLNTLSDFPFTEEQRVTWDDCYINDADCLTPKGFHWLRVRVDEGVWFDLYNLHADAGSDSGDQKARKSNYKQVADYANVHSAGMPIIIMGDTNSRYTGDPDGNTIRTLVSSLGLVDSWVKNVRGGTPPDVGAPSVACPFPFPNGTSQLDMNACENLDKIFVRGSPALTLIPNAHVNEHTKFVDSNGALLSDHYPIASTISWALSPSLRLGDPIGGAQGSHFNGIATFIAGKSTTPKITAITIRAANRVDAISYSVSYAEDSTVATASHGGTGGTAATLTLESGERINKVTLCEGKKDGKTRVFYIELVTNSGRSLAGGVTTDSCTTSRAPQKTGSGDEWGLVAFWGRSGDEVDRVGAVWGAVY
jgi:endonuclease/exonuclease/phosphatase family metal-dependent hydrolase